MVYKIARMADLQILPCMDSRIRSRIHALVKTLSTLYGEDRNIDCDDGGFIVYAEPGTAPEMIRKVFDYTAHTAEYVTCEHDCIPLMLYAHYVLHNEFTVTIVTALSSAPEEIKKEWENCEK